jgi:hypothetical protein
MYGQWAEHLFLSFTRVCSGLATFLGFVRLRIMVCLVSVITGSSLVGGFARVREVSKHLHPFS